MFNEVDLLQKVLAKLKTEPAYIAEAERTSCEEPDLLRDEEISERAEFHTKWKTMQKIGEERGWLAWDYDGSGGISLGPTETRSHHTRTTTVMESDEQYEYRIEDLDEDIERRAKLEVALLMGAQTALAAL